MFAASSFKAIALFAAVSFASTSDCTPAIADVAAVAFAVTIPCSKVLLALTVVIFVSTYVFTAFWVGNKTSLVPKVVVADLFAVSSFNAKALLVAISLASTSAWTAAIADVAAVAFAVTVACKVVFALFTEVIFVST